MRDCDLSIWAFGHHVFLSFDAQKLVNSLSPGSKRALGCIFVNLSKVNNFHSFPLSGHVGRLRIEQTP